MDGSVTQLQILLGQWIRMVQELVGGIGGLAFAIAFVWKIVAT